MQCFNVLLNNVNENTTNCSSKKKIDNNQIGKIDLSYLLFDQNAQSCEYDHHSL